MFLVYSLGARENAVWLATFAIIHRRRSKVKRRSGKFLIYIPLTLDFSPFFCISLDFLIFISFFSFTPETAFLPMIIAVFYYVSIEFLQIMCYNDLQK